MWASFATKKGKVQGPAWEIQFLGAKQQDGHHPIPTDVVNKIATMSPSTSKKKARFFFRYCGVLRMHILDYSQIVNLMTWKKNDFKWDLEQQQVFERN